VTLLYHLLNRALQDELVQLNPYLEHKTLAIFAGIVIGITVVSPVKTTRSRFLYFATLLKNLPCQFSCQMVPFSLSQI
jgi:hypothetical protein